MFWNKSKKEIGIWKSIRKVSLENLFKILPEGLESKKDWYVLETATIAFLYMF